MAARRIISLRHLSACICLKNYFFLLLELRQGLTYNEVNLCDGDWISDASLYSFVNSKLIVKHLRLMQNHGALLNEK